MSIQQLRNLTTLCYIEQDGKYLMLHRVKKENDINKDKWIGVGGHFEADESPEDCVLREVKEETGYTLTAYRFRGIITFLYRDVCEYMCLYTADGFTGEPRECDEGVEINKVEELDLWEGDKIFFRLLRENRPFFSLKLSYDENGILLDAVLDGEPIATKEGRKMPEAESGTMNFTEFVRNYHIQLNEQQMQAVQATEGPVLLLAVPGSGKTTVLVSRLGYMIYCLGITPESILTVTYTVAATNDMRRRFAGMFGEADAERLEFRTINGISQKVLQYFAYRTGKTPFQVADKEASAAVKQSFLEVTGKYATENDIKETQLDITYAKNMRLTPEKIRDMDTDVEKFPEIFRTYNAKLRQMQMIDYDDQMIYALRILEQYPEVLAHFREQYRYFCVDEAQDTSVAGRRSSGRRIL